MAWVVVPLAFLFIVVIITEDGWGERYKIRYEIIMLLYGLNV